MTWTTIRHVADQSARFERNGATMLLDVSGWKDYPVDSEELNEAMLRIAAVLDEIPVEYDYVKFFSTELTPIKLRALWEHEHAGRLWSYSYDTDGVLWVYPQRELSEWRLETKRHNEPQKHTKPEKNTTVRKTTASEEWDAKATVCFLRHRDWTKKQIAKEIGCNEKQLCPQRAPQLTAAINSFKSMARKAPSGSKSADGTIEAEDNR